MPALTRAAMATLTFGFLLGLSFQGVLAQPPGRQTDGNIDGIADNIIYLNTGDSFPINDATRVTLVRYGTVADLVPGRYISLSARPGAGGMLEASVVGLFAEGVTPNEGQRPMADVRFCQPGCVAGDLMTNAAINDARLDALSGGEMTISFADQSGTVLIGPSTRVELQSPGTLDDVVQGANVIGFINDEGVASGLWVYLD